MARTATDGFKFWDAYYDALKLLDGDERRGHFVMALCAYVFDGVEPEFTDPSERFGFTLIAAQAMESKRLSEQAREKGLKSGESRRRKTKEKSGAKPSTGVFNNGSEHGSEPCSEHSSERKKEGLSSSYEEERRGLRTPPKGAAPPPPGDLPPIPGGVER